MTVVKLHRTRRNSREITAFTFCPSCEKPSAVILLQGGGAICTQDWFFTNNLDGNTDICTASGWHIVEVIPDLEVFAAPPETPPEVERIFIQARSAHQRREHDGAAMLYRKTLETAVKGLDPNGKGSLDARIKALTKSDLMPEAVANWAHEIRVIGNDAAHDVDEPAPEDVDAAAEFVEAFLTYAFTMPAKISNRLSKTAKVLLA